MKGTAKTSVGYQTSRSKTDSNNDVTFGKEGQGLLNDFTSGVDDPSVKLSASNNRMLLDSMTNKPAAKIDVNPLMQGIRDSSDRQTQVDIANARSKFYNKPEGRNDINLADTIARNAAARDAKLMETASNAEQFNAQVENANTQALRAQAMGVTPEQLQQQQRNAQILQALSILRGNRSSENQSASGTNVNAEVGASVGFA